MKKAIIGELSSSLCYSFPMIRVDNDWQSYFDIEQNKDYYISLRAFLKKEYSSHAVFPPMDEIFSAFRLTPLSSVKVVLVGQDPYHEKGQAMGLSFSVRESVCMPPSLQNIKKELEMEGYDISSFSSNLTRWAEQGVLLMNTTLTVREHEPLSHAGMGWERFTNRCIEILNEDPSPKVFLLWGGNARGKKTMITNPSHLVLESAHPSPLSAYRGFFGNNHFKKTNDFLSSNGLEKIIW